MYLYAGSKTVLLAPLRTRNILKCDISLRKIASLSETKLFEKILIANRGEIACRIILTAKRLGLLCV